MLKELAALERSQKRGIKSLELAVLFVEIGANEAFTVACPGVGRLLVVFETKDTPIGMLADSVADGSALTTSYTAAPLPDVRAKLNAVPNTPEAPGVPLNGPLLKNAPLLVNPFTGVRIFVKAPTLPERSAVPIRTK